MELIRTLDKLRRICIPKDFLNNLNIWSYVELTIEYGQICIKKFEFNDLKSRRFIGIVRKIDSLNRIVIPMEYLSILGISTEKQILMYLEDNMIKIQEI